MLSREQAIKRLFHPATARPELKDKPAVIQFSQGTERVFTFADMESLIAQAVSSLKEYGVRKGDRVVMCSENSARLAAMLAACWALNAIAVPVDVRVTMPELANIAKKLQARVLAGSNNVVPEFVQKAAESVGDAVKTLEISGLELVQGKTPDMIDVAAIDLKAPAFVILTSGTTGMPKGALHTLESLLVNVVELAEMAGLTDTMRGVLPLPLSHVFGLEVFHCAMLYGTSVAFSELTPQSFVQSVAKQKPHIVAGVPTLYGALLTVSDQQVDLSNAVLLLSGGAPLPISLADEFEKKFGKRINNGYGSTESLIVALNQTGPIEAVGKIVPSAKIEIVNENGEVLPEGSVGEIRISGPTVMGGYLNMPDETKKVLRKGAYHTGDMGYFKDGELYISGRTKEMVIVAGYKVFPVEVEDALRKHPLVREVAVLGQPHRQLGQIVKAVVVVSDEELSKLLEGTTEQQKEARQKLLADLKEYCKENLRRELRPMEWEFQPASKPLPKTATGKVDKKKMEMATV